MGRLTEWITSQHTPDHGQPVQTARTPLGGKKATQFGKEAIQRAHAERREREQGNGGKRR